ncbi:hypothetical protein [Streptomyces sp. NPDC001508]|uniref:hypothetical protein n=1 Tax=Streptomyces sp. NPDC001508 TaxID=3154656 RepID=UPI00331B7922
MSERPEQRPEHLEHPEHSERPEQGDSHGRQEPHARHEPPPRHEHTPSHAGKATVNHGPDDKGPERLDGLDKLDQDELGLRRLLHAAVEDLEPRDGTLDHLRRAVPARRARKRHAAVGMAAAALFVGTAVPAFVHVSTSGGTDPNTSIAGQASQAQGGAGQGKDPDGGERATGGESGKANDRPTGGAKDEERDKGHAAGGGSAGGTGPSAPERTDIPLCTATQLGPGTGTAAAPDSTGVVYGSFRVTNISGTSCRVGGAGTVSVLAQGAADQAKISAVRHVAGDAAAGLPDPSQENTNLLLSPGSAYEEKFAFVPSETCPTGGGTGGSETGGPSADPSPSSQDPGATGDTSTGGTTGTSTQLLTEDGTADGSIQVQHTTQAGAPTVATTVPNACAGTVYWTGVLAGT